MAAGLTLGGNPYGELAESNAFASTEQAVYGLEDRTIMAAAAQAYATLALAYEVREQRLNSGRY